MKNNIRLLFIGFALLCYVTIVCPLQSGEICRTPDRHRGICTSLKQCLPLFNLLQQSRPLPAETVQFLRDSQCGFEGRSPLVCCPNDAPPPTPTPMPPSVQNPAVGVARPKDVTRHRNVRLINSEDCGRGSQNRIFGGNLTAVNEYPWMALLAYRSNSGAKSFKCGGTLINEYYVLTAAHCISNTARLKLVSVRLGEHDTSKNPDCDEVCGSTPQDIDVAKTIIHPMYSTKKFINDIALVRLATPAILTTDSVRPICLPVGMAHQMRNHEKMELIVAGWGATEKNLPASSVLLKVKVPVVATAQCAAIYKASFKFDVNDNQLCAGGSSKVQDSCNGDSGGPLKTVGIIASEPRFIQYGVVSYGHRVCGTSGVPGVYTRVGHYMDWILNNMTD